MANGMTNAVGQVTTAELTQFRADATNNLASYDFTKPVKRIFIYFMRNKVVSGRAYDYWLCGTGGDLTLQPGESKVFGYATSDASWGTLYELHGTLNAAGTHLEIWCTALASTTMNDLVYAIGLALS